MKNNTLLLIGGGLAIYYFFLRPQPTMAVVGARPPGFTPGTSPITGLTGGRVEGLGAVMTGNPMLAQLGSLGSW